MTYVDKEFGFLVVHYPTGNRVVLWAVSRKLENGPRILVWTSLGWQEPVPDKSNYFERTPREQSKNPAYLRAAKWAKIMYPSAVQEGVH